MCLTYQTVLVSLACLVLTNLATLVFATFETSKNWNFDECLEMFWNLPIRICNGYIIQI